MFAALVVDLLHEFELGAWRAVLVHLLRILFAFNKDLIHELDGRYLTFTLMKARHAHTHV